MTDNYVKLIGVLGRDPDIKDTRNGNRFASMSIATKEKWKDKSGEWKESTSWHNVVIWKWSEHASLPPFSRN
jgi:single-strand DNA-binding protein